MKRSSRFLAAFGSFVFLASTASAQSIQLTSCQSYSQAMVDDNVEDFDQFVTSDSGTTTNASMTVTTASMYTELLVEGPLEHATAGANAYASDGGEISGAGITDTAAELYVTATSILVTTFDLSAGPPTISVSPGGMAHSNVRGRIIAGRLGDLTIVASYSESSTTHHVDGYYGTLTGPYFVSLDTDGVTFTGHVSMQRGFPFRVIAEVVSAGVEAPAEGHAQLEGGGVAVQINTNVQ
jgi:hypothetical protein